MIQNTREKEIDKKKSSGIKKMNTQHTYMLRFKHAILTIISIHEKEANEKKYLFVHLILFIVQLWVRYTKIRRNRPVLISIYRFGIGLVMVFFSCCCYCITVSTKGILSI